jgi:hypothetical protein
MAHSPQFVPKGNLNISQKICLLGQTIWTAKAYFLVTRLTRILQSLTLIVDACKLSKVERSFLQCVQFASPFISLNFHRLPTSYHTARIFSCLVISLCPAYSLFAQAYYISQPCVITLHKSKSLLALQYAFSQPQARCLCTTARGREKERASE